MALMTAYGISEGFLQGGTVGLCLRQLVEAVLRGVQSVGVLSGFRIEMQAPEFSLDVAVHGLVEGVGELVPVRIHSGQMIALGHARRQVAQIHVRRGCTRAHKAHRQGIFACRGHRRGMAVIDDDLEVMRHEAPQSGPGYGLWAGGEGVVPVAAVALRQLERAQAVDGDGAVRAGGIQRYAVCLAVDADGEGMRIVEGAIGLYIGIGEDEGPRGAVVGVRLRDHRGVVGAGEIDGDGLGGLPAVAVVHGDRERFCVLVSLSERVADQGVLVVAVFIDGQRTVLAFGCCTVFRLGGSGGPDREGVRVIEGSVGLLVRIVERDGTGYFGLPAGQFRQVEHRGRAGDHRGVVGALNLDLQVGRRRGLRSVGVDGDDVEVLGGHFASAKMLRLPIVERVGVVAVLIDADGAVLAGERVDKLALVVHELEGNDVVAFVVFAGRHLSGHLGDAAVFNQRSRVGDDDAVLAARDDGGGVGAFDIDDEFLCI